jgi:hypothetical protein
MVMIVVRMNFVRTMSGAAEVVKEMGSSTKVVRTKVFRTKFDVYSNTILRATVGRFEFAAKVSFYFFPPPNFFHFQIIFNILCFFFF